MRKDLRWKATVIFILTILLALVVLPTFTGKALLGSEPIRLGLDLKGGIELLLEPDYHLSGQDLNSLQTKILDGLKGAGMTEPKVEYLGIQDNNKYDGLVFTFANAADLTRAKNLGIFNAETKLDAASGIKNIMLNGTVKGNQLEVEVQQSPSDFPQDSLERAVTIIEHRINEASAGMAEADVRLDKNGRIFVQLPGINSLQKANDLITSTGRLTFRINGKVVLDGTDLQDIKSMYVSRTDYTGYALSFQFKGKGSQILNDITTQNIGKNMAVYLDESELMDPRIQSAIPNGSGEITLGNVSKEDADRDALLMKSGALPISLKVAQSNQVAPTLGAEIVRLSLLGCVIGIVLVMIFMLIFYGVPGLLGDAALILVALIMMGVMAVFRGVMTLPGIAGIVLTMGVAVDANIIIFERVKDELRNGKRVRPAVDSGFKRAFITVLDCHATLIIVSAVLYFSGNPAIQGFATTLFIGSLATIFTATFVTKFLLDWRIDHNPDAYAHYFGDKEVLPE